ncbi:MAG: hypothetical protein LBB54_00950 [Cellulomonadaceae bacterium]|jgi:esterase/lipase superfamily enzyme|nr:hypothetical protein [Cellulomonadaceae bacterium]
MTQEIPDISPDVDGGFAAPDIPEEWRDPETGLPTSEGIMRGVTRREIDHRQVRTFRSRVLKRDMTYRVYGDRGKPVIAFPTSQAHENLWEDFGMVDTLGDYINAGIIQLYALDCIDDETFFRPDGKRRKAMRMYERWLSHIVNEFVPTVVAEREQKVLLTGASMGAYHAANLFFRWPRQVDGLIALSGVYSPAPFLDFVNHMRPDVLANSPLDYLTQPVDSARLEAYAAARLVFCAGGAEPDMRDDTIALGQLMEEQGIAAWVDIWGDDVTHDWPWWHKQISYFLPQVLEIEPL